MFEKLAGKIYTRAMEKLAGSFKNYRKYFGKKPSVAQVVKQIAAEKQVDPLASGLLSPSGKPFESVKERIKYRRDHGGYSSGSVAGKDPSTVSRRNHSLLDALAMTGDEAEEAAIRRMYRNSGVVSDADKETIKGFMNIVNNKTPSIYPHPVPANELELNWEEVVSRMNPKGIKGNIYSRAASPSAVTLDLTPTADSSTFFSTNDAKPMKRYGSTYYVLNRDNTASLINDKTKSLAGNVDLGMVSSEYGDVIPYLKTDQDYKKNPEKHLGTLPNGKPGYNTPWTSSRDGFNYSAPSGNTVRTGFLNGDVQLFKASPSDQHKYVRYGLNVTDPSRVSIQRPFSPYNRAASGYGGIFGPSDRSLNSREDALGVAKEMFGIEVPGVRGITLDRPLIFDKNGNISEALKEMLNSIYRNANGVILPPYPSERM